MHLILPSFPIAMNCFWKLHFFGTGGGTDQGEGDGVRSWDGFLHQRPQRHKQHRLVPHPQLPTRVIETMTNLHSRGSVLDLHILIKTVTNGQLTTCQIILHFLKILQGLFVICQGRIFISSFPDGVHWWWRRWTVPDKGWGCWPCKVKSYLFEHLEFYKMFIILQQSWWDKHQQRHWGRPSDGCKPRWWGRGKYCNHRSCRYPCSCHPCWHCGVTLC